MTDVIPTAALRGNADTTPADAALTPVSPAERIGALDVLRGWAMFGVLWSNLNDWYGTREPGTATDRALAFTQEWLLEGRFYALLCLLFGIGFAIQLQRAADRGADVMATYRRRTLALLGIGLVHAFLIWPGDILTLYALVAFALMLFRTTNPRQLPAVAFLIWFIVPYLFWHAQMLTGYTVPMPPPWGVTHDWVLAHGSWLQIERIRVTDYLDHLGRFGIPVHVPSILALFLLGMWAMRSGYLRRVIDDPKATRRLLLVAVVATALGTAYTPAMIRLWPPHTQPLGGWTDPWFWMPRGRVVAVGGEAAMIGNALVYAAMVLTAWQRPLGRRLLQPLAAAGRMALTTYLTQSVVCTLLFYGYGLGWYGRVRFTGMLGITLVLFACQMAASTWWLARYQYGPVEWLWRRVTYGRALPMRLRLGAG